MEVILHVALLLASLCFGVPVHSVASVFFTRKQCLMLMRGRMLDRIRALGVRVRSVWSMRAVPRVPIPHPMGGECVG